MHYLAVKLKQITNYLHNLTLQIWKDNISVDKGPVVNRALRSLHEGLFEITPIAPLYFGICTLQR